MTFSEALVLVRQGRLLRRWGWNAVKRGQQMFIYQVPQSTFEVNRAPLAGIFPAGTKVTYLEHIDCWCDGSAFTWTPSMLDLVSDDWEISPPVH